MRLGENYDVCVTGVPKREEREHMKRSLVRLCRPESRLHMLPFKAFHSLDPVASYFRLSPPLQGTKKNGSSDLCSGHLLPANVLLHLSTFWNPTSISLGNWNVFCCLPNSLDQNELFSSLEFHKLFASIQV